MLRIPGAGRPAGVRGSVVAFVLMSLGVVAATMSLLVLIDPRTQAYWSGRVAELLAMIRALVGR